MVCINNWNLYHHKRSSNLSYKVYLSNVTSFKKSRLEITQNGFLFIKQNVLNSYSLHFTIIFLI